MEQDKPFKTSDLGLATYLATQGFTLLGCIESGEDGRLLFVFIENPEERGKRDFQDAVMESAELYNTGKGMVSAKHFFTRARICKRALQTPLRAEDIEA